MSGTIGSNRPVHILIVDDERDNRNVLEVMLKPEGFVVATAASGADALAKIALQAPDLVLLDVLMPGMGGYELAGRIKGNPATKNIPIVMVTALGDRDAKLHGLTSGAEDFLSKPIDRAELCTRVRNLLRLKACSDEALARRDASMAMVGHELRNVLNCIVLKATMITRKATDSEEGRQTVAGMDGIQGYAARMDRLIGDLMDVASIDAGKVVLKPGRCDVIALLAETIQGCVPAASEQGITLDLATVERPLLARFDRERILQVLTNLITNAIKFTGRGGTIIVRAERADVELQFTVRDNGAGIPSDKLTSVFERFLQVDKDDRRGLGLGLYISRCIVESHGGRLWAESKLGEGSTFHFTLPGAVLATSAA